jgi:hypothetical protein
MYQKDGKVKIKFALKQAVKAQRGCSFFNFGSG